MAEAKSRRPAYRGKEGFLLYLDPELKAAIKRDARLKRWSAHTMGVWLLERGIDWFEGLSREQRESA